MTTVHDFCFNFFNSIFPHVTCLLFRSLLVASQYFISRQGTFIITLILLAFDAFKVHEEVYTSIYALSLLRLILINSKRLSIFGASYITYKVSLSIDIDYLSWKLPP